MTAPLLDALFALNGGRLRPYYKYLTWELTTPPVGALSVGSRGACLQTPRVCSAPGLDPAPGVRRAI
jgi:hypothetical protein